MFQGARLFQRRLDDDFVEKSEEYANEALGALGEALSWRLMGVIHSCFYEKTNRFESNLLGRCFPRVKYSPGTTP